MENKMQNVVGVVRAQNARKNQKGLTVMEYAVAAAALIGVAYFAMNNLGSSLSGNLQQTSDFLSDARHNIHT